MQYISEFIRQVSTVHSIITPGIVPERQRDSFGDIVFETVKCEFTGNLSRKREDEDASVDFLADAVIFYASVFPNALILIVLPSEYYGVASFDDSIFDQNLRTKFYGLW